MSYLLSKNREAGGKESRSFCSMVHRGGHWYFWFWLFFRSVFSVFVPKNFGFSVLVFIAVCEFSTSLVSVFAKNTNGFSDLTSDAVFGFSYLTYLGSGFSSIWAAITRLQ